MSYDFQQLIPGIEVAGIDVSAYAIEQGKEAVRPYLQLADARALPYASHSFDLVISINTLHNLKRAELIESLKEVERVGKGYSYITVDAYRTEEEKELMFAWNLTAQTILHVEEWRQLS